MRELKGLYKKCLGCNKLENPNFVGTDKCEYFSKEQIKMEGFDEISQQRNNSKWNKISK